MKSGLVTRRRRLARLLPVTGLLATGIAGLSVAPATAATPTRIGPPVVTCTPNPGFIGSTRRCIFTPRSRGVVGYTYQLDAGTPNTIAAGPDGTATVTVKPDNGGDVTQSVRARLRNGNLTAATDYAIHTDLGDPIVDQSATEVTVGTPVVFTFHAVLPGSVLFAYSWECQPVTTVPVGPDGTTTVTLTTDQVGSLELDVLSATAGGPGFAQSGTRMTFVTSDPAPGTAATR